MKRPGLFRNWDDLVEVLLACQRFLHRIIQDQQGQGRQMSGARPPLPPHHSTSMLQPDLFNWCMPPVRLNPSHACWNRIAAYLPRGRRRGVLLNFSMRGTQT